MKSNVIISAVALGVGPSLTGPQLIAHELNDLPARADPKTMDPARLAALSVLKTAIATEPAFPRPTGDFEPEWYQKLPDEIKRVLPSLYPAVAADASATMSVSASTSSTMCKAMSESDKPAPAASATFPAHTSSPKMLLAAGPLLTQFIQAIADASASPSTPITWTSQVTVMKTLQHVPSCAAGHDLPSNGSSSAMPASTNGAVAPLSPSPSVLASGSAKVGIRVEKLAAIARIGIVAGFSIFA
ncbi:hypothetical protein EK21DRAFT_106730 [Setomelanomma holmii]|uniref:Uncharacterized protein n=1 Tax=Setomelanomma holmii TaxID=210430 RepID=A0A9P4HK80_9PLEO|nr:hypothetical protein EK21DRAFT_106730 [Setomelanomma holmii]